MPFAWKEAGVHLYSGSAHKFHGPKGVGFLLVKEGIELLPVLSGGGQEHGWRSGTPNLPGIVGMSQALRFTIESMNENRANMYALRRQLLEIIADIPELHLNGYGKDADERCTAPHIVNVSYPGMRPEVLVHMLEKHGILISTQSACSSRSLKPSRVLLAMGLDEDRASGSMRISLGDEHTERDIQVLGERLRMAIAKLKPLERSRA
ncbi:cysteine desulfurase family protein [Cohnella kolymensis]|uniref:cysteine desulfurase family protein n=1 Tax=Cohnella kolymensis TaxID=1590652 RepID=UPI000A93E297